MNEVPAPWWRRERIVLAGAALLLAAFVAPAIARRGEVALDDVFITYRYAQNLAAGQGFVFNPGERVFGTTAPGFGLLLAGLHLVTGVSIPWLGSLSTGLSAWALGVMVFAGAHARGRGGEAFCGALLFAGSTYLWVHSGSEIPLALALLAGAAVVFGRWPAVAGVLAGVAVWCRPDALLGAGVIGLLEWRRQRRLPWRYGVVVGGVVALGLGLAWSWFGEPLPSTLEAKRIQASLGTDFWRSGVTFWAAAYQALTPYAIGPEGRFSFFVLGLAGWASLLRHGGSAGRALGGTTLALLVAYPLLRVPFYTWYSIPLVAVLFFGLAFAAGALARWSYQFFGGGRPAVVLAVLFPLALCGTTVWPLAVRAAWTVFYPPYEPRYELYRRLGEGLAAHAREGDDVAFVEVGTIAYFSRLPVRDLLGLVTPESRRFLRSQDLAGAFLAHPTSLFLFDEKLGGFVKDIADEPWFEAAYQAERSFSTAASQRTIVVYRRVAGAPIPPPREPS